MTIMKFVGAVALFGLLTACDEYVPADKSRDRQVGRGKDLSELVAGIWVDPNGCDHWIIDDGVEGYLSERLTPDGRPVCSGVAAPTQAVGPFKAGGDISDRTGPGNFRPSGTQLPSVQ